MKNIDKSPELLLEQFHFSDFDFMWAERYLVAYIELMTPVCEGNTDHWLALRAKKYEHVNFIDTLARSLFTSFVISYSRPWSGNRDRLNKREILPESIFEDMNVSMRRGDETKSRFPFNNDLHERVVRLRNKVIAHSDGQQREFNVVVEGKTANSVDTHAVDPFVYFTVREANELLVNTSSLRGQLGIYRRDSIKRLSK